MKKKTLRKIAGLVLSAALCLSLLPAGALAADDRPKDWWMEYYGMGWQTDEVSGYRFYVDEYCNIHWDLNSGGGGAPTDTPDSQGGAADPAPEFETDGGWLKKYNGPGGDIVVPDGVTTVGRSLFADRTDVTSVILPDSVTVMDSNVFYGCTNLTGVTMGSGLSRIGNNCFRECSSLTSVVVPDGVESIGFLAFADCPSLTSVTLPESVTYLSGDAFEGSPQVVIYGYTGSYVEDCALEMGIPFVSLGGTPITPLAKELEIRDGFLKGMKVLGMQLEGDLIIPENVTVIGSSALSSQYYLTGITIPSTVTTIEDHAMESCRSLTGITIPNSVTSMGESVLAGCHSLTGVTLSNALKRIEAYSFGGCTALKSVTIPDGMTYIGDFAFRDCESLTDVTIPGGVTYIGEYAFNGCVNLKSVTVPESVTTLGYYAFDAGTTIYGVTGSAAEAFAKENGNPFVSTGFAAGVGELPGLDTASKWARESLQMAYAKGLIPAPLQSSYTRPATRAEFCALATALYETATGAEAYGRTTFTDTTDANVEKMAYLGVVTGVGGGRFDPDGKLTREQAATMLARLANVLGVSLSARSTAPTFADNASISSWAFDAVGQVQAGGVMSGVGNNQFAPQVEYSREQSILTMYRLYELVK